MNTKQTLDFIAERESQHVVMLAYTKGATIQYWRKNQATPAEWCDVYGDPLWDWEIYEYRVKPEPQKVVLYRSKATKALLTIAEVQRFGADGIDKYFDKVEFVEVMT